MELTGDDALKELVKRALHDVFGFDIVDLDDETPDGEQKTLDLLLRHGSETWVCEVRSRGNGNLREIDLDRFERNYARAQERHGDAGYKLLVFNGMYRQLAAERSASPPFGSAAVVEEATDRGIGLVSVHQILQAIQMVRNADLSIDELIGRLKGQGVVDLPGLSL